MTHDLFNLKNKTIIVTGSAGGNGLAIAKSFYNLGANLVLTDKNYLSLKKNTKSFSSKRSLKLKCDINQIKDRKKILDKTRTKFNYIHGLVNNAGISISNNSNKYKKKDWDNTINTNLSSIFFLTQLVANHMVFNRIKGSIINITSLASHFGMPDNPAYVASKGGLKYLTKAMAIDYGQEGIRINNLSPGYIFTNMTKKSYSNKKLRASRAKKTMLNKWGQPNDIIGAAVYLMSDSSQYVTGIDLHVDGGWAAKGI